MPSLTVLQFLVFRGFFALVFDLTPMCVVTADAAIITVFAGVPLPDHWLCNTKLETVVAPDGAPGSHQLAIKQRGIQHRNFRIL